MGKGRAEMGERVRMRAVVGIGGAARMIPTRTGKLTAAVQQRFLDTLAATSNVSASARAIGVRASKLYALRESDPAFAAAWERALSMAYERLEQAMLAYAASRFAADAIDPDAADPVANAAALATRVSSPEVSRTDLEMAMALLNRSPRGDGRFTRRRAATREESDAVVREKLNLLAAKLVAK
jgi:hypothetical protein